jgi:hypothetical protein
MGFWSEFVKSFKEQAENSKELNESMAELKKLQESEGLKKTKESVEKLKDKSAEGLAQAQAQLKNLGEKAAATGGRVTARMSDSVTSTLGDITQRVGIDEKLEKTKEGFEKVADSLNKARENIEKVGENIKTTAEESELVKKVKEKVPFGLLDGSDAAATEGSEGPAAGPRSQLVVKTQEMQTAIEKRLHDVRDRLRATGAFKKALALREKIVESDNPIIQRMLDLGDGITRSTSKLFSENDHAKTIKLIHELDPNFSPEKFKQAMASSFVPTLRSALLRGDPAPINACMSKRLAEHELEAYKEWDAHGYRSHSKLLNLDTVEVVLPLLPSSPSSSPRLELPTTPSKQLLVYLVFLLQILNAHTRDDGRPTLLIHFVSQENHCIRDSAGAVVEGAPVRSSSRHFRCVSHGQD